jgi:hypothetical protein
MQGFLGTGDLYMDRLTSAGVAQGFMLLGNATKFEIQPDAETKELVSRKRDTAGQVLASVTKQAPTKISITLNEYDKDILALAFLGDVTTQAGAGATVTNEEVVAKAGKYVSFAHREVSSVTVSHKNGDNATTWATGTAYTTSNYVKPTSPNNHFYKCTVAGTSHAATEPTWPTDGTTVTDGTATWQDMGTIVCSSTTDYTLLTRLGMIKCLSTGDIIAGETLNCDYTWAAQDGYDITGGVNPIVKAYFRLDGKNDVNGKKCIVDVYEATVKPSSPIDFLSEDFAELQLEGTLVTPTGLSTPMNIDYHE